MFFDLALYLAVGAVAGVLAGLLGIGGGLIIVAALVWILPARGFPLEHVVHVAVATAMASIVFTSLSSAYAHWRRGSMLLPSALALTPGLLLGGWLGAMVASQLPAAVLRIGVAAFCATAATQLWFGRARASAVDDAVPRSPLLTAWGVLIGAIAAIVGIGGGSMIVPLLVWFGARPVRAVGTSSACGFVIAIAGAFGYVIGGHDVVGLPSGSAGFVYLPAAAGIALTSVALAPAGARLAHAVSSTALKRIFAVFLVAMGIAVLAA